MNTDETTTESRKGRHGGPRANSGGLRPGGGRPRKGSPPRIKTRRKDIDQIVEQWEASAEMEVRAQAARRYLAKVNQEMQAEAEGGKAEPEIPQHMMSRNGKLRRFASVWSFCMAVINDPVVQTDSKIKLAGNMLPFEKPKLAEKALGKKEERNAAAQNAGKSSEFEGLMDVPKGPRLAVSNSGP